MAETCTSPSNDEFDDEFIHSGLGVVLPPAPAGVGTG